MTGSGPDDGDIIEMSDDKPRRTRIIGGRTRRVIVVAGVCVLLAVGASLAAVQLSSRGPAVATPAPVITPGAVITFSSSFFAPAPSSLIHPGAGR